MIQHGSQTDKIEKLSVRKAILIGQLIVNLPVTVILIGSALLTLLSQGIYRWIFLISGFIISWLWWSYTVPRWRKWAVEKGAPANELHEAAVISSLEWPKGSIFEKTEIKVKE